MYNILITLFAAAMIVIGSQGLDGGLIFKVALFLGGVYIGHVITDALDEKRF